MESSEEIMLEVDGKWNEEFTLFVNFRVERDLQAPMI